MKKEVKKKHLPVWAWILIIIGIIFLALILIFVITKISLFVNDLSSMGQTCDVSDLPLLSNFVGTNILVENNTYLINNTNGETSEVWKIVNQYYNGSKILIPSGNYIKVKAFRMIDSAIDKPSVIYLLGTWKNQGQSYDFESRFALGHAPGMQPYMNYPFWTSAFNNLTIDSLENYLVDCKK